ncbi:hypothetical protein [Lysinibacillus telephonicus]|uniref:hypothetical protein n=1 Tax=Lysinibacillus telephonicus TaxID=1714840 RepID=UPI003B9DEC74
MNFKDALEKDLSNVFFNATEFAESANINGKDMLVVIDDDELERQKILNSEELVKAELLFFVEKKVFGNKPRPDALIDFNKKRYRILKVNEKNNLFTFILERYSG